jgi:hypothetical protein
MPDGRLTALKEIVPLKPSETTVLIVVAPLVPAEITKLWALLNA